jgi:hypothetical protein
MKRLAPGASGGIPPSHNLGTTIGALQAGRIHNGHIDAGSREQARKLRGQTGVAGKYESFGNSRAFRGHGETDFKKKVTRRFFVP